MQVNGNVVAMGAVAIDISDRKSHPTRLISPDIIIVDTGVGIPPQELPHVFEPLYSTRGFGVGLGLASTRHIVEGHGGNIRIDSRPGTGTRVTLNLPNVEMK